MTDRRRPATDDRAVSIAVTHVLTVGISTLLIAGLLIGASGMLDAERERAGRDEIAAIGDRHAAEIVTAVDSGARANADVTVRSRQPDLSIGGPYVVSLTNSSHCRYRSGYDGCILVATSSEDLSVEVPVTLPRPTASIQNATVQGGQVVVEYYQTNDTVTLRGEG